MKILIQKNILIEKLSLASKFTSSRLSSLSVLQGVLIKGEENTIHFYSTDLNSYFHTTLKIKEKVDFQIAVEPKKIIDFLSLLSSGQVNLEIKEKQLNISSERTKGVFPLLLTKDFPMPPKTKEKAKKIKSTFFMKNLPLVLFSASTDQTRPALSGINFLTQEEEMIIVATDGFRLSLLRVKKEADLPSMIIPSGFLSEILRLIKDKDVEFEYLEEEKTVVFKMGEDEFYSRLIEGDYPPFEKVIPTDKKTTIVVDREEFLRKVRLISVFARDLSHIVLLKVEEEGIKLQPKTEKEDDNVTQIEAKVKGEDQTTAFNYKFLLSFLNSVNSKNIIIEMVRADSPVVFRTDDNENFLHIIMPVKVE